MSVPASNAHCGIRFQIAFSEDLQLPVLFPSMASWANAHQGANSSDVAVPAILYLPNGLSKQATDHHGDASTSAAQHHDVSSVWPVLNSTSLSISKQSLLQGLQLIRHMSKIPSADCPSNVDRPQRTTCDASSEASMPAPTDLASRSVDMQVCIRELHSSDVVEHAAALNGTAAALPATSIRFSETKQLQAPNGSVCSGL